MRDRKTPRATAGHKPGQLLRPAANLTHIPLPLALDRVSAGFPSPAQDFEDKRLDINEYLIRNPVATFFFEVSGVSMSGAGIFDGDLLVVDRSIEPQHGQIVVAFVHGERLVKRLALTAGSVTLLAEHPDYPPLKIAADQALDIWGVVIGKFARVPV